MRFRLAHAAALLAFVALAAAEEPPGALDPYKVDGSVSAGYRLVDIDGSKDKYREDYNLRSGGRLFSLVASGRSSAPDKTPLDRFHLEVDTPGDEPLSHFRLSAADQKWYDLNASFTRSKYVYAVPQLFEQPVPGDARTDDLHDFNLVRTNGVVDLSIHPPNLPTLLLGYRLYERHGDATSTVLDAGGDSFVVRAPVHTAANVGRAGTEFRALGTDVFVQQEYRRVDRQVMLHDPLDSAGLDPTDASTLTALRSRRDERLDVPATTVRVRRPVGDALELTGAYFYSHAELDFGGQRRQTGTTGVPGLPDTTTRSDHGGATLDSHVADLGATYRVTERVRLHATYRFDERSQDGDLAETGSFGTLAARTGDHLRVHSVTGDVELQPRDDLTLRGGVRWARRDANLSLSAQDIATDTVGAVGSARYRPWHFLDLFARYENVQIDDPFTVPGDPTRLPALPAREIALTFTNRGTAGVRLTPRDWCELSYQLVADSRENASFAARSRAFGNSVALTVSPRENLTVMASYTRRDLDNRAEILLAPIYRPTASVQNGTEDVFASELRWDFGLAGERWSTGWDVAYVNAGNALRPRFELDPQLLSFFDLDRVDGGAFLTLHHRIVEPTIEFRMIDYNERVLPRNDYRATIVTFKLTKRFSL